MSDYVETARKLWVCGRNLDCAGCEENLSCVPGELYRNAAIAIEELTAQVKDKDYLIQQQTEEIQRLKRDVKKQQEKMIELAKALTKRGGWVRSDELLPDDNEIVLVCNDAGFVHCAFYAAIGRKWYIANNTQYDSWTLEPYAMYWMPLPEPPKEDA